MLMSGIRRALAPTGSKNLTMQAWRIPDSTSSKPINHASGYGGHEYSSYANKLFLQECNVPTIAAPGDVLVKVHASSVNPIDLRMYHGYGRKVLDWMYWISDFAPKVTSDRHPLVLGRDFSGEVVAIGNSVTGINIGDMVYGVTEPHKQGSHAQYVTSPQYCLYRKPDRLTHIEATSVPYVALTAWSALCTFGLLNQKNSLGKRVLILGGSGGIGSFSIQLLKGWGAHVTATCSEGNTSWLESTLMVDQVVSYDDAVELENLKQSFDFVLDAGRYDHTSQTREQITEASVKYLKPYKGSTYVTISPPILENTDKYGVLIGTAKSSFEAFSETVKGLKNLNSVRWALFMPNRDALGEITKMIEMDIIKPIIHDVHNFVQLPEAYDQLEMGKARGKIVIDHTNAENIQS